MNNSKRIYRAAIYVRLSKEDGDLDDVRKAESNSISNQKSLILNYLKDKEDIEIVSIREDDGYSGATFDRPAFKLMMQDVKDGIIDCIVVKDLSRFAREYIDAGRYIERMFPAMGIRFIAINDAYDSADTQAQGNEIIIPFKNLINDAYCRDISIKIRSHLETKRQNGEFVGNYCVYGYKKSEIDHNVIVPDEYAGHVVQDIFRWIKNGMSLDAISDKLNVLGILSPMAYKLSNGENYKTAFQKKDELLWTPVAVRRIATNIIYTGTLVQGKFTTPNHKVKTKILKPQEKWAVCHNNHEALVSLRTFQIVQRLLSVDMRMAPGKDSIYLLSGIAVCADCGALMTRKVSTVNGKKYVYYMCSNNKKNKKCSSHRIKEADLESRVFDTLRDMTAILLDADEVIKEAGNSANFRIDQKKTKERISAKEKEITKYNQMLVSLYEDYRDGIVDKSDFAIIKESFEVKRAEAEKAIDRLQKEAENIAAGIERDTEWLEEHRKWKTMPSLTRNVVVSLIQSVKSARRTRNLSGEYTASFVCYGYKKDPDDKHKLIIDEEAAKVVVEIFSLIIAGYNASEVARMLNERKIPTRVQNQWKNGINYVPVHNKGDYMWDNSEVIAIVQNEQYKGIMIQNKCETVGFGDNKKVRKRNKEDWSVVEGAIPRIVSDEMFDEVNKMLRVEARGIEKSTKKRKKNLFICPYCGRKLMNSSAVCTPKLLCPKRRMVRTGECQQIFMLKSEAQDKVLEITKEICRTLIQEEELKKASKDKRKVTSDEYLISELKAEYDRISNSTVSCYQSYREGKYTKEEYVQLRKKNQELLADLENQISDLQEKVANQEPDAEEKIEQLTQYSMLEQYDGDVLSNIIDKVFIYNDKDIEIVFKGENFIRNAV